MDIFSSEPFRERIQAKVKRLILKFADIALVGIAGLCI